MHKDETKPTLVYKCGEAWRIDSYNVKIGIDGILRIMHHLEMIKFKGKIKKSYICKILKETQWIRSPGSGLSKILKKIGSYVKKNELIANITDPFGSKQEYKIVSPFEGIIISTNNFPLLNEGDYLIEIANNTEKNEQLQNLNLKQNEPIEIQ
jgi:hypothetical protein